MDREHDAHRGVASWRKYTVAALPWQSTAGQAADPSAALSKTADVTSLRAAVTALLALATAAPCIADSPAATPRPVASARPARTEPGTRYCPLSAGVLDLDGAHTRYAVSVGALQTGLASGIVSLFAANRRYDIPFRNMVVVDSRDKTTTPSPPVVVRFPEATVLDGAAVTAIGDSGQERCDPVFNPWIPIAFVYRPDSEAGRAQQLTRARAQDVVPLDAPVPVADPVACPSPNVPSRTVSAFEPRNPAPGVKATVQVVVLLDTDDKLFGTRVQLSSGNRDLDRAAVDAAARSRFQGAIFRCRHVIGAYIFSVMFS